METIIIILLCLISLYIGYTISKGIDNNHRELFQAYMDEQIKLNNEKEYYKNKYENLIKIITENQEIKECIINSQGEIIDIVTFNKEEKIKN